MIISSARSYFFRADEDEFPFSTTRCAKTGTASGLKSSGVQKLRPSRKAVAWAANLRNCLLHFQDIGAVQHRFHYVQLARADF